MSLHRIAQLLRSDKSHENDRGIELYHGLNAEHQNVVLLWVELI